MLKKIFFVSSFVIVALVFLTSCDINTQQSQKQSESDILRIAISKEKSASSNTKYADWLLRHNVEIEYFNLYPMGIDSAIKVLNTCNGLLLTGGRDVFPANYGKIDDTARCGSFDQYRDSLEFALIEMAIASKMPIFGVCRGEQILNVSQGGTLYIDIPTDFDTLVSHRLSDWSRAYHPVRLVNNTIINEICIGVKDADVVTNHHQGIEHVGTGLLISAYSEDNLPEAIEWENGKGKGFLMAVQWHPEAMDTLHPLSAPLAKKFLLEAASFNTTK
ncbi:MAG: gamma-glutamyl-gamma-aminobutyrate hydrolase family protein [Bacteroidota bacterium]